MSPQRCTATLALSALTLAACPDPPPPADYQKPLARPKEKRTRPKALPPMRRPKPKTRPLSPKQLVQRECEEIYRQRVAAAKQMQLLDEQHEARRTSTTAKPARREKARKRRTKKAKPLLRRVWVPDRATFFSGCARLPIEVVRCMNPTHPKTAALRCIEIVAKLSKSGKLVELWGKPRHRKRKRR